MLLTRGRRPHTGRCGAPGRWRRARPSGEVGGEGDLAHAGVVDHPFDADGPDTFGGAQSAGDLDEAVSGRAGGAGPGRLLSPRKSETGLRVRARRAGLFAQAGEAEMTRPLTEEVRRVARRQAHQPTEQNRVGRARIPAERAGMGRRTAVVARHSGVWCPRRSTDLCTPQTELADVDTVLATGGPSTRRRRRTRSRVKTNPAWRCSGA